MHPQCLSSGGPNKTSELRSNKKASLDREQIDWEIKIMPGTLKRAVSWQGRTEIRHHVRCSCNETSSLSCIILAAHFCFHLNHNPHVQTYRGNIISSKSLQPDIKYEVLWGSFVLELLNFVCFSHLKHSSKGFYSLSVFLMKLMNKQPFGSE